MLLRHKSRLFSFHNTLWKTPSSTTLSASLVWVCQWKRELVLSVYLADFLSSTSVTFRNIDIICARWVGFSIFSIFLVRSITSTSSSFPCLKHIWAGRWCWVYYFCRHTLFAHYSKQKRGKQRYRWRAIDMLNRDDLDKNMEFQAIFSGR